MLLLENTQILLLSFYDVERHPSQLYLCRENMPPSPQRLSIGWSLKCGSSASNQKVNFSTIECRNPQSRVAPPKRSVRQYWTKITSPFPPTPLVFPPCSGGGNLASLLLPFSDDPQNAAGGLNKLMDSTAEFGRNPVSKQKIQPEYGDEQADAGRDCRTGLARPNSQA